MLSLWCLPVLLLFGSFPGQLEARASSRCIVVCCFPPILPGFHWFYVRALTNQRWASGVRVSTLCGTVSILENIVLVHGVLEL